MKCQKKAEMEILIKTYILEYPHRFYSYETKVILVSLERPMFLQIWSHKYIISCPDKREKEQDFYPREAEIYAREIAWKKGLNSITIIPPEELLPMWVSIDSSVVLDKDNTDYYKRLWDWSELKIIRLQEPDSVIKEIGDGGNQRSYIHDRIDFYSYDSPKKTLEERNFIKKNIGNSMYKNMETDLSHVHTSQKVWPNGYFLTWDKGILRKKISLKTLSPKDFFEKFQKSLETNEIHEES